MRKNAIQVSNLSKRYLIGATKRQSNDSLRKWLASRFHRGRHDAREEAIWALKDVTFEVAQGEVVAVIGRNGAGKSTLLKILSRITEPTSGRVVLNGRVGSLLEVGTGFHPELTGRENIYLSGAILGMKRREIGRRFDEILDFSGVEKYIDTPIKRYSSGMKVRLGFAVAAHMEPEILIVDEVLAVGDMAFQKKCLGKMGEVADEGRSVLFVSHNLQSVRQLCDRGILIDQGEISIDDTIGNVIAHYYGEETTRTADVGLRAIGRDYEPTVALLERLVYRGSDGQPSDVISENEAITMHLEFSILKKLPEFDVAMAVVYEDGTRVFSESRSDRVSLADIHSGSYSISFSFAASHLKRADYYLAIFLLSEGRPVASVSGIALPRLEASNTNSLLEAHRWGVVRVPVEWSSIKPLQ